MKIENGNMKMQNMKMQNMKIQNMKMQNIKMQNMKIQNMKIQNVKMFLLCRAWATVDCRSESVSIELIYKHIVCKK